MEDFAIPCEHRVALAGKGFIFCLLGADASVLQEIAVRFCKIFHKCGLLVVGLEDAVLMRTEFLELSGEELRFMICYRFLVED